MSPRKPADRKTDPLTALERRLAADKVEFVRFEQSDTHGISRSKTIPTGHVRGFAGIGLNFPLGQLGFTVQADLAPNTGYLEELGIPDSRIRPDLGTYRVLPWADRTARLLCEPYFMDGRPAMAAPRAVARKLLGELAEMGYRLLSGFEYEFYLVHSETRQPAFPGVQMFATLRNNFDEPLIYRILRGMSAVGVDIITSNAEYGPGQMEINFAPEVGILSADNAFTFKNGVKEIAQRHGYIASFMTRPYADQSANGCHFHQNLLDLKTGRNAFVGSDGSSTDVWRWWLGGQIMHMAALCALAAPTVNCPKAFGFSPVAPTNATWGVENRTAAFRMKYLGGESAHIENRVPRGGSNPYLVMAGTLAAGLDGLKNKTEPPAETTGVAHGRAGVAELPARLEQSLTALESDGALRAALGEEFIKLFVAVKRHEIGKARAAIPEYDSPSFKQTVYEWERSEYFEFL
jgi:glutamine synthetase